MGARDTSSTAHAFSWMPATTAPTKSPVDLLDRAHEV